MNRPIKELRSIVEFAHSIRKVGDNYEVVQRSYLEDTKDTLTRDELESVCPGLCDMVRLLARRPGRWNDVSGAEALMNVNRIAYPTVFSTKRGEKMYVANLSNAVIAKGIVQLHGDIYRLERYDIYDGTKPQTFYATGQQTIGKGFTIGLEVIRKQFPQFRERLELLKSLDVPGHEWAVHLFTDEASQACNHVELPTNIELG